MKKLSKNLSKKVLATLNKDPNFQDVYQLVLNRSKTKPYLVGGKLYRTLVELIYGYPARSVSCDFDFAAEDVRKTKFKKKKFMKADGTVGIEKIPVPYEEGGAVKMHTQSGCSIDLICLPDLADVKAGKLPASMEGYFAAVPLSIQAIAMDLERCEIFGKVGLDSINEKYIWVNNKGTLIQYCNYTGEHPNEYIREKAESIRFGCDSKIPRRKKKNRGYKKQDFFGTFMQVPLGNNWFNVATTAVGGGIVAADTGVTDTFNDEIQYAPAQWIEPTMTTDNTVGLWQQLTEQPAVVDTNNNNDIHPWQMDWNIPPTPQITN
jgi:hypothetical protein